jgi:hypothetical protein
MPTYDYLCETNGHVIEVSHAMQERLTTWGELCNRAGLPLGDVSPDAPVKRVISGPHVVRSTSLKNPEVPPCQTGAPCCGANNCGFS